MKDKLIELITVGFSECTKPHEVYAQLDLEALADYLIVHGVTVQADVPDNNVGNKWIPVEEELPETIPCAAGTAYSNAVNALTSGRKVITAIFDGEDFIGDAAFWDAEDEVITHWTPVLLPLPPAPKEVE